MSAPTLNMLGQLPQAQYSIDRVVPEYPKDIINQEHFFYNNNEPTFIDYDKNNLVHKWSKRRRKNVELNKNNNIWKSAEEVKIRKIRSNDAIFRWEQNLAYQLITFSYSVWNVA